MKDKIKKISKYVVNSLNMINMLLIGLAPIWDLKIDKISQTIVVVAGVISAYLVYGKMFKTPTFEEDELETQNVEMPDYGEDEDDSI